MGKQIKLTVEGYGELKMPEGSTLLEVLKKVQGQEYMRYLGARINNEIYPLYKDAEDGFRIQFLDNRDVDGYRIYTKTISAVFIMACKELYPDKDAIIHHFLGPGLYAELDDRHGISFKETEILEEKMKEIISRDISIERSDYTREEALEIFREHSYSDKIRLISSMDKDTVSIYRIGDHIDSFHGYLAPSTGFVEEFKLKYYYPGVIILFPSRKNHYNMDNFKDQKKLAKIFKESNNWLEILDLANIGSLNERINNGHLRDLILISEALHEKRIAQIADKVCEDQDINMILIAGPSSSGKTTFANRLSVQLKVNGKRPISISMDDYFVNREDTPLKKDGEPDFESIDAIDLKLFNRDLVKLLEGESVQLPRFNFVTGKREPSGKWISVDKDHPIIIEGIHGLNPKLTIDIPEKNKFKVYISALTQLNIDNHNRISTTDTRLIRRMVRDVKFRGNEPSRTFELWQGVRAGEEKYIFPFQEEADAMFNSSLVYEMSVLKKYIMPLLQEITPESIHYSEAKKLLKFLKYFNPIEDEGCIPPNSIIREFIGS
ncbi:nucleoside kinase [Gudongella sp. SC589]|uniref:nucleoside kinase n=1 Tax=Gudongella sp. SC589 TaxID=3385990 RepID=UPI003904CA70